MSRSQLPLNALRAFEAAARHASFTHAAEELHVTQAAVSHQVKALEERLGVALFVRRPRGLEITGEGQALLPDLRDAFDRMTYDPEWAIWLRAVGMGDFKPKRVLTFDSTMIAVEAAMEGAGVAVGPPQLFREELAEGRLFQPFPQIVDSGKAWWFVCPPASASRPKTRAFEDWLVEELSAPQTRSARPTLAAASRR